MAAAYRSMMAVIARSLDSWSHSLARTLSPTPIATSPFGSSTRPLLELRQGLCLVVPQFLDVQSPQLSSSNILSLKPDQTYYVIDMVCWAGFSLYECTAEFSFFWLNSKLVEVGACDSPSTYQKFRFSTILIYDCDHKGLQTAYSEVTPYAKNGLLFLNKHAHYQTGNTPLALVWKDENGGLSFVDGRLEKADLQYLGQ